jgi:hypothetical protein
MFQSNKYNFLYIILYIIFKLKKRNIKYILKLMNKNKKIYKIKVDKKKNTVKTYFIRKTDI